MKSKTPFSESLQKHLRPVQPPMFEVSQNTVRLVYNKENSMQP